jgi:hypothetical protein
MRFQKQTLITDYFHPVPKQIEIKIEPIIPVKRQRLISDFYELNSKKPKIIYGYNSDTNSWHCLTCGVDMGPQNPRQLCGKWRCLYTYSF